MAFRIRCSRADVVRVADRGSSTSTQEEEEEEESKSCLDHDTGLLIHLPLRQDEHGLTTFKLVEYASNVQLELR